MVDTSVMSSIFLLVVCGLHLTSVHLPCLKRQEENRCMEELKRKKEVRAWPCVQVVTTANMWVSILYLHEILSITGGILLWLRTGRSVILSDYDLLYRKMLYQHYPGQNREDQHKFENEILIGLQKKKSSNSRHKSYRHYSFVSCVCFISVRIFKCPTTPS